MKSLEEQLVDYAPDSTKTFSPTLTHYIGIPSLLISLLMLLSWFSISIAGYLHITFAWVAVALMLVYYFRLHVRLGTAMTIVLLALNLICTAIAYPSPTTINATLVVILLLTGLILQFSGQLQGKQRICYRKSLRQIAIAPIYLLIEILKLLKLQKHFGIASEETKSEHSTEQ